MPNTTSEINWGQFASEYRKLVDVGDVLEGTITEIGLGRYQDNEYPEVTVREADGSVVKFSATQTMMKRELGKLRPGVGDSIRIEFEGVSETSKAGQHPAKLFKVDVVRKDAAALLGAEELI